MPDQIKFFNIQEKMPFPWKRSKFIYFTTQFLM